MNTKKEKIVYVIGTKNPVCEAARMLAIHDVGFLISPEACSFVDSKGLSKGYLPKLSTKLASLADAILLTDRTPEAKAIAREFKDTGIPIFGSVVTAINWASA